MDEEYNWLWDMMIEVWKADGGRYDAIDDVRDLNLGRVNKNAPTGRRTKEQIISMLLAEMGMTLDNFDVEVILGKEPETC